VTSVPCKLSGSLRHGGRAVLGREETPLQVRVSQERTDLHPTLSAHERRPQRPEPERSESAVRRGSAATLEAPRAALS